MTAPRLRLDARLTPHGGRDRIEGWMRDADGRLWLKARVAAPAVEGAANAALVRLTARALGRPANGAAQTDAPRIRLRDAPQVFDFSGSDHKRMGTIRLLRSTSAVRLAAGEHGRLKRLEIDGAGPQDLVEVFGLPPSDSPARDQF